MNLDILSILWFTVMGLLGGVANVVANSKGWENLKEFSAFKKTVLGAVIGLLYSWLYSEYNWPNNIMSFVSGYAGQDFILRLIKQYQKGKETK